MALKQGSSRESGKRKSSNQSSGNKVPPSRGAAEGGTPVKREKRGTAGTRK